MSEIHLLIVRPDQYTLSSDEGVIRVAVSLEGVEPSQEHLVAADALLSLIEKQVSEMRDRVAKRGWQQRDTPLGIKPRKGSPDA